MCCPFKNKFASLFRALKRDVRKYICTYVSVLDSWRGPEKGKAFLALVLQRVLKATLVDVRNESEKEERERS